MTAPSISRVLEELRSELDDVKIALDFVTTASSIRPRLGAMLNWAVMDAATQQLAQQFMSLRDPYQDSLFRGLYVNTAASYENFVRKLIRVGAELIGGNVSTFDELDEALKNQNIYWTGRAFDNVFGRRPHVIKLDLYRLSADIGTCLPGNKKFRLNADAFSLDVTSPTADVLDHVLSRIGVTNYWDDVGRHRGIQRSLSATGVREAHRLAKEFLNRFVERRNMIAHVGGGAVTIVETDVREAIEFFDAFSGALGDIVSKKCAT